jgi:hypothetical protein
LDAKKKRLYRFLALDLLKKNNNGIL